MLCHPTEGVQASGTQTSAAEHSEVCWAVCVAAACKTNVHSADDELQVQKANVAWGSHCALSTLEHVRLKLCRLSAIPIPVLCERKLSLLVASTLSAHAWRRSADAAWSVS